MSFITMNESAMFYECGFSCDNGILFKNDEHIYFITDSRYTLEAKERTKHRKNIEIIDSDDLVKSLFLVAKDEKDIVFDPFDLNLESYNKISSKLNLKAEISFHKKLRMIKSEDEINIIKKSQKLNKKAFKKFAKYLSRNNIDGRDEYYLNFKARQFLEHKGKYSLSFSPIVALNKNAAKPHAQATKDRFKKGDLILFDAGIKYNRYCSDMTRSAYYDGEIRFSKSQKFPKQIQKIYDIVLKAQKNAINKARSGMMAKEIDHIARDIILKAGYGDYFTHSTGHGIGLDIHEFPIISRKSDTIIEDGMVFSIEPGIYIPNDFGIRIEDLVVMKNGRAEIL
ncbi:X-Pro aminopeptidase [Helicobacter sp. 16-1353]|uniref:M24 family metallopeptidase n=1 Tax=Helicobacter sp. 16-1353 TaxID=2004996 RepID=UPI000DCB8A89|nr:M24 family metallopeptidase [Helicobacter sp. 16-1353]RAX53135.1 X-Pro aminopeptidase [Helicobacter sp. 16-1353]